MAKTSVLNIRTTPKTKKAVEELYSYLGITVSDAVNIFFSKSLMVRGIPFDVTVKEPNTVKIIGF
ncbi:MAG: type II toxin-antitoxin system RelB/DinJ family antitoxin [Clostridiales bacterium]|jgi:DNA-damage-inducible protein J|nr:type II toxin-antitoxin system RelB/DinJ family antitoxin [Clostridiales bacterium]